MLTALENHTTPFRDVVISALLFVLCMILPDISLAQDTIKVGLFSEASSDAVLPAGWEALNLGEAERHSEYILVEDDGVLVVQAVSENAASAMVYPIKVDLKKTPIVQWRWKIDNILNKGDAARKEGDDYPARLYILFDYDASRLSWFEKLEYEAYYLLTGIYPPLAALNYLWANKLPVGTLVPNIYSERVQMYAVNSGSEKIGEWVTQQRNIYEDYLQAFGEEPPAIAGIAIMTDTDNTGEKATAYYGDIRLLAAPNND